MICCYCHATCTTFDLTVKSGWRLSANKSLTFHPFHHTNTFKHFKIHMNYIKVDLEHKRTTSFHLWNTKVAVMQRDHLNQHSISLHGKKMHWKCQQRWPSFIYVLFTAKTQYYNVTRVLNAFRWPVLLIPGQQVWWLWKRFQQWV